MNCEPLRMKEAVLQLCIFASHFPVRAIAFMRKLSCTDIALGFVVSTWEYNLSCFWKNVMKVIGYLTGFFTTAHVIPRL